MTAEYDSAGARQARYTRGPGIDEPVGMLRGSSYYAYHEDALGSVTRLTDSARGTPNTYRYDAWGTATTETEGVSNPFRYTGREKDSGVSLYDYRARTYDPDVGRFTSKDPSGMADGTNLYAYAGGNPVNFVDPTGMGRGHHPPPPHHGRGNGHGHGGHGGHGGGGGPGNGGGTVNPSSPSTEECWARWVDVGSAFAAFILVAIFGYAGYTSRQAVLPMLIGIGAIGVGGLLPGLAAALWTGDFGLALDLFRNAFLILLDFGIHSLLDWWTALLLGPRVFGIWAYLISLVFSGAMVILSLIGLKAAGC